MMFIQEQKKEQEKELIFCEIDIVLTGMMLYTKVKAAYVCVFLHFINRIIKDPDLPRRKEGMKKIRLIPLPSLGKFHE